MNAIKMTVFALVLGGMAMGCPTDPTDEGDDNDNTPTYVKKLQGRSNGNARAATLAHALDQYQKFEALTRDAQLLNDDNRFVVPLSTEEHNDLYTSDEECATCPAGKAADRVGLNMKTEYRFDFKEVNAERLSTSMQRAAFGTTRITKNDSFVWSTAIEVPDAGAVRVHFVDFDFPQGAELYMYSDYGDVFGPETAQGTWEDGEFWSNVIMGETVYLEVRFPRKPSQEELNQIQFTVDEVVHMRNDRFQVTGEKMGYVISLDKWTNCMRDASCYGAGTVTDDAKDATAAMIYSSGGGQYVCTGALVNNAKQDLTPYFMTANHCIGTDTEARSLNLVWKFKTRTCDNNGDHRFIDYTGYRQTRGANLIKTSDFTQIDYSLLRLQQNPPAGSYYLGWDASKNYATNHVGNTLWRISHPRGAMQSYSEHKVVEMPNRTTFQVGNDFAQVATRIWTNGQFGESLPGSSGAILFNYDGLIVGVVSTGDTRSCSASGESDGSLYQFYNAVKNQIAKR